MLVLEYCSDDEGLNLPEALYRCVRMCTCMSVCISEEQDREGKSRKKEQEDKRKQKKNLPNEKLLFVWQPSSIKKKDFLCFSFCF